MILRDVRFALRQIARTPLLSGVVIAVIALGIAINAGLLTVLDRYAWQPAPGIARGARLARLMPTAATESGELRATALSYPDIQDLQSQRHVFTDVTAWRVTWVAADLGGGAERVAAVFATPNYFRVLGVHLAAGAGFAPDADASSEPVVVIGHSLWLAHFDGSPRAIGATIRVMNRPFTIVGVAPPLFAGVDVADMGTPTIWMPVGARAVIEPGSDEPLLRRDAIAFQAVARLADGVDASDVGRMTAPLAARIAREEPTVRRSLLLGAERLTGMRSDRSDTRENVLAFLIVAGLIVVITCTNVSALLLGRAVARRREIGVRLSLGASRWRIARQMLTESLVLATAGGALALLLYAASIEVAYATIPEIIPGLEPEPSTWMFAAIFALVTTIAVGVAPALHASRVGVSEVIKNSGTQARGRTRLQSAFVVAQLASSMPVLVVTSLVLVNLRAAATNAYDQAPASVVTMNLELRPPLASLAPPTREARDSAANADRATYQRIRQRLLDIPAARHVALSAGGGGASFHSPDGGSAGLQLQQVHVTPDYFAALGFSIVQGRGIGPEDDRPGSAGVVVSEAAAQRMWPGGSAIGKRLARRPDEGESGGLDTIGGAPAMLEVIGVARPPLYDPSRTTPTVYMPMAHGTSLSSASLAVRASGGNAGPIVPAIRAAVGEVDPLATIGDVATLADRYRARARDETLANAAAFAIGCAALLLASLGLYAIIAFGVAQRTREIGIRLAVGATSANVVRQFLRGGLRVTALALLIGLPITVAGIRVVQAQQVGFTLRNAAAVMLVVPVLVAIAAIASWLPARRAGRVDPLIALRSD